MATGVVAASMAQVQKVMKWDDGSGNIKKVTNGATSNVELHSTELTSKN